MTGSRAHTVRPPVAIAITTVVVLAAFVFAAPGHAESRLELSLRPARPVIDAEATLTVSGMTDEMGVLVVAPLKSGTSCPARTPDNARPDLDNVKTLTGSFTQKFLVYAEATTRLFCAYLQPANVYNGELQWTTSTQALAHAGLVLPTQIAGAMVGQSYAGVSGGTRGGYGVTLDFNQSGTRIIKVRLVCGGNPMSPPSLGKEFIGKRFGAKVSLPLTRHIKWSGLVAPDNSQNYDAPVPAAWTRPTRFALDVHMTFEQGTPRALIGTGMLTSPGLPCPKLRRYVANS
jgi:hypothetical protein